MKRPFVVTLFSLLVLLLAVWSLWSSLSVLLLYDLMRDQHLTVEANLLFVMGLTWALGFGVAAWGIWRLRPWGRTWTLIAVVAYWLQYWVMRLTLTRAPEEATRRPADFLLSLLGVAFVVSFLFLPKIRRLYRNE